MHINEVTTQELLALLDNRFDILTGDAARHEGPTLSWIDIKEEKDSLKVLPEKIKAIKEIRDLLNIYEGRIKTLLK